MLQIQEKKELRIAQLQIHRTARIAREKKSRASLPVRGIEPRTSLFQVGRSNVNH